jgi:N-acetylneuraminic acid mutarotase
MKINYLFLLMLPLSVLFISCNDSEDEDETLGNWSSLSDFDGLPRSEAVGFVINGKAYFGTGYDGESRLKDFWEYNPEQNYWTQKADLPGDARASAVGFSVDNKGYIGTGYNGENKLNDFWEYDPASNQWTQKADFIGSARYGAVSFGVDGKGYVGSGYDGSSLKDFYAYSPTENSWEKIISIGGSKRRDASAFVIDGKAFVISGTDNGVYLNDMWEFNPITGNWTEKNKLSNFTDDTFDDEYSSLTRINGSAFSINGKGYLTCGSTGSLLNNVWEYDPLSDLWVEKTPFEGSVRTEAVGFAIGSKGYVVAGRSSSYYFDDIWGFDPTAEYDELY